GQGNQSAPPPNVPLGWRIASALLPTVPFGLCAGPVVAHWAGWETWYGVTVGGLTGVVVGVAGRAAGLVRAAPPAGRGEGGLGRPSEPGQGVCSPAGRRLVVGHDLTPGLCRPGSLHSADGHLHQTGVYVGQPRGGPHRRRSPCHLVGRGEPAAPERAGPPG